MFKAALVGCVFCVVLVHGRPQNSPAAPAPPAAAAPAAGGNVTIVKDAREPLDPKGAYKYDIELSDGTKFVQEGATEAPGAGETEPSVVIKGSYSYISPDGTPVNVMYIANKDGFQPTGDVIPKDTNSKAGAAAAAGGSPPVPSAAAAPGSAAAPAPVAPVAAAPVAPAPVAPAPVPVAA